MAADLAGAERDIKDELGLSVCHRDPGVAAFGLVNALFCAGDTFVEVVSPDKPDTTAGRYLERNGGDGGYMAIFQLSADERAAAIERAEALDVRQVWSGAIEGIAGTHFHPKDLPGAIVSVDTADDPASWPWAGDEWATSAGPGSVCGLTIAVSDPSAVSAKWAEVLGAACRDNTVQVDGAELRFVPVGDDGRDGITAIDLAPVSDSSARAVDVCGVRFTTPA